MRSLILVVFLFLVVNVNAKNDYCTIKGESSVDKREMIELFRIENGNLKCHTKTKVDKDGKFAFLFIPEVEGFYYIGSKADYFRIYVKKSDKINIGIDENGYRLVGKSSRENKMLYQWYSMSKEVELKSVKSKESHSTYEDFFPLLEKIAIQSRNLCDEIKTSNKFFDSLMKHTVQWDLEYYALNFIYSSRAKDPSSKDYVSFYKEIVKADKFDNDLLLWNPYALCYIEIYNRFVRYKVEKNFPGSEINFLDKDLKNISNEVLKGEYILEISKQIRNYGDYCKVLDKYEKYLISDRQKKKFHSLGTSLRTFYKGDEAVNFTCPDVEGKKVSLFDFKGKIVLVDVWSTWCGPCKREIPHLEKLEKEFHGKDIVFISVSVDTDKNKWLKMVKEKNLGGVQLWANGWGQICKDYKIKGIPRFMLFDRKGNVISIDAPRPSDPKLKELINQYL